MICTINRVFSKDPAPEIRVMLDLHPEDIVTPTNNTDHFVFRLLGQIITMGIVPYLWRSNPTTFSYNRTNYTHKTIHETSL